MRNRTKINSELDLESQNNVDPWILILNPDPENMTKKLHFYTSPLSLFHLFYLKQLSSKV
jgi:hypothetical protein